MKKLLTQQFMGVIAGMVSIILSLTLYAYKSDQNQIQKDLVKETIERKNADTQIRYEYEKAFIEHEKLHLEQKENNELLIKYLDQRFDDMEKLINSKR